jgi:FAD/FMN-containing dehydrogenase
MALTVRHHRGVSVHAALDELAGELGDLAVLRTSPDDPNAAYSTPARGPGGAPAHVVRPASTDEVRSVVRWARRHRVRVLPQGANSGLVGASTPPPQGRAPADPPLVVLSTERLVDGLEVDIEDRIAIVPAGIRLSALNEVAGRHGLWFPIDLAADPAIGGMVATNTGGARMLRHGDVRRRTLGVEVVLADDEASIVDTLRTFRKNNTGIDLTGTFVGSSGRLGIITRAAVDLSVVPAETMCLLAPIDRADDALALLIHLESALGETLAAFEVMSAAAIGAAAAAGRRSPTDDAPFTVLVEAAGAVGSAAMLERAVATSPVPLDDALVLPPEHAWAVRHAITDGLRMMGTVLGHDVAVPRRSLPAFRTRVIADVAARWPDAVVADFGHWGDGGVHCNVVVPATIPSDELDVLRADVRDTVFDIAVGGFGGSYSAEHGIGPGTAAWWRSHTEPAQQRAIAALVATCDPLGVLGHPDLPY